MRQNSQINTATELLRDDQYALIVMDKNASYHHVFPISTEQEVMESCVEFNNYHCDLGPSETGTAAHFLKEACKTWGIDVPPVIEDFAFSTAEVGYNNIRQSEIPPPTLTKQASHQVFALKRVGKYAIDTPELVKEASGYFDKHWNSFSLPDRRDFAKAVQSRADTLGVGCSPTISKFASDSYNQFLGGEISLRKNTVRDTNLKSAYARLFQRRHDIKVDTFVDYLDRLDKKAGFGSLYGSGISDPLAATVGVLPQASFSIDVGGNSYDASDVINALNNLSTKSPGLLGATMIEQLKAHPELFTSLPMPDQETIMSYGD